MDSAVGDMAVTGFYPLFQMPGIGTVHQHLFVMIGLNDNSPASFQFFSNKSGHNTEIGRMAIATVNRFDDKSMGIDCIMSCLKRIDLSDHGT